MGIRIRNARAAMMIMGALLPAQPQAAADVAAGQAKAVVCGACHGPDGNSAAPEWPSLAGQSVEYLVKQLHDFQAGRRKNETMSPMAQPLSRQDIEDLAAFFAAQRPKKDEAGSDSKADAKAVGREIYERGRHRPKVPACIGCHGPRGEGNRDWNRHFAAPPAMLAPAIGGQQSAYLQKQLLAYRKKERTNDVGHVMRDVVSHLGEADIAAVAEYITGLQR